MEMSLSKKCKRSDHSAASLSLNYSRPSANEETSALPPPPPPPPTPRSVWSDLPADLGAAVAQRLTVCADFLRFATVCPSWHSAATVSRPSSFVPYLLVPYGGAVHNARGLYSLQDDKVVHRVVLPKESQHWRCVASCEGWLFIADLDANIFLYNPLSGSRVDLPSQAAVCKVREVIIPEKTRKGKEKEEGMIFLQKGYNWPSFEMRDFYFWKACLSSPVPDFNCVVMIVYTDRYKLAYARPGDKVWAHIKKPTKKHCAFLDIVYHNGRFYALNDQGLVLAIEITDSNYKVAEYFAPPLNASLGGQKYLVFVPSGRLYLISRFADLRPRGRKGSPYRTDGFDIFELVREDKDLQTKWVAVNRLADDCAVFVGHNSTFVIPHSKASGFFRTKCIYYTDDNFVFYYKKARGGHDNGIYSIEDETFARHYVRRSKQIMPPPIWITPNLN